MLCSVVVFEQVFILCCVAVEVVGPEAFVGVGGCAFWLLVAESQEWLRA